MALKKPNPVDIHVGARLKMRRMLVGMSQEKLGEYLGLTFQQIQKYEKGMNRMGASRIYQCSETLGVSPQFFFDDMTEELTTRGPVESPKFDSELLDFIKTKEGYEFNMAFQSISSPKRRKAIVSLFKSIGED